MSDRFEIEEVEAVQSPPKARVVLDTDGDAERKRDYLAGFLAQKPQVDSPGEPGGAVYDAIIDALKDIYDPEIPVNIVDLGLVYDVEVNNDNVAVKMTLTAPGCGMGTMIAADAKEKILALEGVNDATVDLVWDPPWDPSRISDEAKQRLGIG